MVVGPVVAQKETGEGEWCHETSCLAQVFFETYDLLTSGVSHVNQ